MVGAIEARDGDTEARPARNMRFTLLNGELRCVMRAFAVDSRGLKVVLSSLETIFKPNLIMQL